jgi:ribulose-phosphate 3-epimerase
VKIVPSILAADFTRLGEQIREAEAAGGDQIHIDIMDGRFVPTISFGVPVVAAARRATRLPLDVHLMIVEPEHHLAAFKEAGADMLTVHIEACPNLHRVLQQIRGLGLRAGVALNPHTPATLLSEILHLVDVVLVMTVNPGAGGQTFLNETLPKIKTLRGMAPNVDISVDGGIEESTIRAAKDAGANVFVAGTSIFGAQGGIQAGVERLKRALG